MTRASTGLLLVMALGGHALAAAVDEIVTSVEQAVFPRVFVDGEAPVPIPLVERMHQLNIAGVSIAVVSGGEIAWTKGYGFADKETGALVTPETLFQAASISKPVTAMAALSLVRAGSLDLDANVNELLNSWKLPDNEFTVDQVVTVRRLLNHTAGTSVWGFPGYERGSTIPTTIDVLDGRGNTEAIRVWKVPGESWRYSGGGYIVLQQLLTDVSGHSFPDLMQTAVFEPLGMAHSTMEQPLPQSWQNQASSGYDVTGTKVPGNWHVYPEMAAAGLWTTPTDLARFILEIQRAYHENGRVLSHSMALEMLKPGLNDWGLGLVLPGNGEFFLHGGGNAGFRDEFIAYVERGDGVVIMTNSDGGQLLIHELKVTIGQLYDWPERIFGPIRKTAVKLDPDSYQDLVGRYRMDEWGITIEITKEQDRLFVRIPNWGKPELLPESEDQFFSRDTAFSFRFSRENGVVTHLTWDGARGDRIE